MIYDQASLNRVAHVVNDLKHEHWCGVVWENRFTSGFFHRHPVNCSSISSTRAAGNIAWSRTVRSDGEMGACLIGSMEIAPSRLQGLMKNLGDLRLGFFS